MQFTCWINCEFLTFFYCSPRVGVEHLGTLDQKNQAQIGSSYQGVADDHHGRDQRSCPSIGKLMRNIKDLRKNLGDSGARVPEVSYNPGKSLLDGSRQQGFDTETPSPPHVDGMSPSAEGGEPQSFLKKPKRRKKKRHLLAISHV
ncbi:hypothetical protein Nepgr_027167 [Nepenthes gracilis]|uniref:Uncharacterized protein n=1 Tax=Nepenthes gracilis TaxID=150966 RepID=A0AAD3TAC4_NEPGR|nr:hypothetical protein Nepgr_027167 [Nepenthes gracilis]